MIATELDTFTRAYVECALWSSLDDEGNPLDANYGADDIAPETLQTMIAECEHSNSITAALLRPIYPARDSISG